MATPASGRQDLDPLHGIFATAHQEWRESQTTAAGAVFQSVNHAYQSANYTYQNETVEAIANLATAPASDCSLVALTNHPQSTASL